MSVKVLKNNDTWYGMTYHEDIATVKDSFKKMLENGVYKTDCKNRVTPKFCVKSNECRNRAKFICGRQRLAVCRLCLQHNAGGDGCQGRRSRSFNP